MPKNTKKGISKVDHVMLMVKQEISNGTYTQGDKLPNESELMQLCDTSRSSIREAIKILSAMGIVEIKRGVGTFVTGKNIKDDHSSDFHSQNHYTGSLTNSSFSREEFIEYRESVENCLMELIIKNADDSDIDRLELCNLRMKEVMESSNDIEKLVELDLEFHYELGRCTKNRIMESLNKDLMEKSLPYLQSDYHKSKYVGFYSFVNHRLMIDALRNRDLAMCKRSIDEVKRTFYIEDL